MSRALHTFSIVPSACAFSHFLPFVAPLPAHTWAWCSSCHQSVSSNTEPQLCKLAFVKPLCFDPHNLCKSLLNMSDGGVLFSHTPPETFCFLCSTLSICCPPSRPWFIFTSAQCDSVLNLPHLMWPVHINILRCWPVLLMFFLYFILAVLCHLNPIFLHLFAGLISTSVNVEIIFFLSFGFSLAKH